MGVFLLPFHVEGRLAGIARYPSEKAVSLYIFFSSSSSSTLFPFLSRARAGGPFSRGTAVEKKDGPGRFFRTLSAQRKFLRFSFRFLFSYIFFFLCFFFFVNIYNEIFITSY